jgi:hypothetical protein
MSAKPKFKVGQVVFWRGDDSYPFTIDKIERDGGVWLYYSDDSAHEENSLRAMTPKEFGR